MNAPFPFFGGKRSVVDLVWARLGRPRQYVEPFCGSCAMLFGAPAPASLEVVGDCNGFIANFWRAVKHQPIAVAEAADYPVSHVDLGARHRWLMGERERLAAALQDPFWPGDALVAGWWLWGQCAWIGSGWCEWDGAIPAGAGQVPHVGDAGMGIQAVGRVPHVSDAGQGIQAIGQVPHVSNTGQGIQAIGQVPHVSDAGSAMLTSSGRVALAWLGRLAARLERVRVLHGAWDRCLHLCHNYAEGDVAVFLDPPYRAFEAVYGGATTGTAEAAAAWAREHPQLRIAICGFVGDYDLDGWTSVRWTRPRSQSRDSGSATRDREAIWFSPGCLTPARQEQRTLFAGEATP